VLSGLMPSGSTSAAGASGATSLPSLSMIGAVVGVPASSGAGSPATAGTGGAAISGSFVGHAKGFTSLSRFMVLLC